MMCNNPNGCDCPEIDTCVGCYFHKEIKEGKNNDK